MSTFSAKNAETCFRVFSGTTWVRMPSSYQKGIRPRDIRRTEIEPDDKETAYAKGIRKFFRFRLTWKEPAPDEWGTIAAWSWA